MLRCLYLSLFSHFPSLRCVVAPLRETFFLLFWQYGLAAHPGRRFFCLTQRRKDAT